MLLPVQGGKSSWRFDTTEKGDVLQIIASEKLGVSHPLPKRRALSIHLEPGPCPNFGVNAHASEIGFYANTAKGRFPFAALQAPQTAAKFALLELPPDARGTIWSSSMPDRPGVAPQ